ncbi:NADP-dependent phosphogluconate dehydrogenase [Pelagibius sp. Alg239-R121]|uniref:NADP-dependent phosphogluconate dehydrogenase n=1 Tax=Pelagibius sp. Alg239-R121 TaxID=2993448 RepID=UPI0024A782BB|nr:NADP-dependent phosphogluconate dehydrogenase [Pelagibius sp. Alg239-R121]
MASSDKESAVIGLLGLGTMGANLALNIAEKGFKIAVFNRTVETTRRFHAQSGGLAQQIVPCDVLEDLVSALKPPRSIILMLPAGEILDQQIAVLRELLDPDDLIIDAGNANFHDTNRRTAEAKATGVPYLGIGVSGGEEGARHGPSIMGGGPRPAWDRVSHILGAIAAKHDGQACAQWMGEGGAGHFVKSVHNGIEYADMQMIAEVYGILRDGFGMTAAAIGEVFARWNKGPLKSYLIEISAEVSSCRDAQSEKPMLDVILDRAGQKGTGRWTAIEALHLASPATVIEAAVAARNLSSRLGERKAGEAIFGAAPRALAPDALTIDALENALIAGKIVCYAQGFGLLASASDAYGWSLPLPEVARVWRAGCIIRSSMLNDMAEALTKNPTLNLMFSDFFAARLKGSELALREVVAASALAGLPAPALSSGLAYFDMMRTSRSTANMIQAQRDFFGAHSFERIGEEGAHHGPWHKG